MPLALNGYELGLLVVALVFIAFALVVALVVPRARPDFPASKLGAFLAVVIVLFAAQMTAVLVLAELGEDEPEAAEEEPAPTETTPTETTPTETTPTETVPEETTDTLDTETTGETETTGKGEGQGDATAGREVFLANCAGCHTLADAGTSGTIGPNLDAASPSFDKAVERVTNGQGAMPSFKDTLTEQQIRDVATYVSSATEG